MAGRLAVRKGWRRDGTQWRWLCDQLDVTGTPPSTTTTSLSVQPAGVARWQKVPKSLSSGPRITAPERHCRSRSVWAGVSVELQLRLYEDRRSRFSQDALGIRCPGQLPIVLNWESRRC